MRIVNRTLVVEAIRRHAPISRADIARLTSISAPTVSSIVSDLIASGLVRDAQSTESEGGRPPRLLTFSERAFYVGCDLSTSKVMRVGLVNLNYEVVDVQSVAYEDATPDPALIVDLLAQYVEREAAARGGIQAVGIGAPGVTEVEIGKVRWAPTLGWRDVELAQLLTARLKLPVVVDNDVNLALIGEVNQGAASRAKDAVFVSFRDGVGGAILIDGRLYRGRGGAGEVGYLVTGEAHAQAPDFRAFGFTERRIFDLLAAECRAQGIDASRYDLETQALASLLLTAGGDLVLSAEARASLIQTIAAGLASISALLDPEAIVLTGWIEALGQDFLADVARAVGAFVSPVPLLRYSELGPVAVIAGAAISAGLAATEVAEVVARV
jgi:glucokinase